MALSKQLCNSRLHLSIDPTQVILIERHYSTLLQFGATPFIHGRDFKMEMTYHMEGVVNGRIEFTIDGEGKGNPLEGHQELTLDITKDGMPYKLPFAFDLLSAVFCYGNRCFTKYPDNIPDYFKQAFPGGLSWERTLQFEDGGYATASAEISLKGNCFHHKSKFVGQNFPTDGPVMQNKTHGWEPSTEKMTVRGETVKGDVPMFLKLEGGENHRCIFTTTYKAKKKIPNMPQSHFIGHRITSEIKGDGTKVEVVEDAIAHLHPFGKPGQ